ncbi:hypothetical protein DFJ58DRAFT_669211 [Suillus subalutaceus]|uniref:uncharacterized protein n=1 Tax=Suillus subalutaceus TaxID=48586 RepID=UPI001B87BEDD|nr:uncharacterized protein DFJ58DRAFT_669211 [Suillus subalutaceus]KAG1836981.1 hypothetical protein DFJ58DRAFT_669211 [Suillus subalutaceus]
MPGSVRAAFSWTFRPEEYVLLTTSPSALPRATKYRRRYSCSWRSFFRVFTLRKVLVSVTLVPVFLFLAIICQGIPPNYEDIRSFEHHLPQHSLSGHQPQYLRFPGHLWGFGFNNVLQEAIMMSYLAYVSNVSFVFEDYTWSHLPLPWTIYDFALRPARIPFNALISGPTAGGPMPSAPDAPRAVSAEFYAQVCGGLEKKYIITSQNAPNDADGVVMIDWWADQLASVQQPCIEIDSSAHVVFDSYFFGNPRILSLWESLTKSPMLTDFAWSPLVQAAVSRNFALFQPESAKDLYDAHSRNSLAGLVALHLRRGDYKRHCPHLAEWGADYMGINQHPSLPDRFDKSPYVNDTKARLSYYLDHCWPSTEQVVERLRGIRREYPGLRRVYVLSNEWAWSLDGLKSALEEDGWDDLVSSADIVLDSEQKHVAMAVDMAIAEKAEVFIGNGFSSLSSNVVMLRMAKGMEGESNRFL